MTFGISLVRHERLIYIIVLKCLIFVPCLSHMVDKSRLAISKGQLGPVCDICGALMTFGESCTIDDQYVCIDCYESQTGAASSTDSNPNPGLRMQ